MIAFVHGPDSLLVRQNIRKLSEKFDPTGSNTTRVDGTSTPPDQIAVMIGTPAFLGMGRLVIVDDLFTGKRTRADKNAPERVPPPSKASLALLTSVAEGNQLIFSEPGLRSVPAPIAKAAPEMRIYPGLPPRGHELFRWVENEAATAGTSIAKEAVQALLDALYPGSWQQEPKDSRYDLRPDLDQLQQEIRKLALVAHPNPIRTSHVQEMVTSGTKDELFDFLNAFFSGQQSQATQRLRQLLDNGDDHFRVLAQLMQQIELAVPIESAAGIALERIVQDIANESRIGKGTLYRFGKIQSASRSHPVTPLLPAAVQADRDQKQGRLRDPEDVILAILDATGAQKRSRR